MVVELIENVPVEFPFQPYECQSAYMKKVIQALDMKCDAALESPTGTGKTLSLLCSTLAWVQKQKAVFVPTLQQTMAVFNEPKGAPMRNPLVPRIYYSSRTHSQLSQVVRELNKTVYKSVPTSFLASRDQLCIHDKVSKEKDNQIKSIMCRSMVNKHTCHYYNQWDKCNSDALNEIYGESGDVMDIEDLVSVAKKHSHCPYFRSRQMTEAAELILLPYNYLISPELRRRYDVDLKGSIVIFDEAHNLEAICEDCISMELSTTTIALAAREMKKAIEVLSERTEEIRSELDMGNQAFSTGLIEAAKKAKEGPPFEIGVACRVIEMLCEFEKHIFEAYKDTANYKTFNEFPGKVYAGKYLLDVLEKADFGYDKAAEISNILSKAAEILHEEAETQGPLFGDKGGNLQKLNSFLMTVYCSHTKQMAEAVSETHKVKYNTNDDIVDKFKLYLVKDETEEGETISIKYWCFSASLSMKLLKAQGARSIIVTSGTLSPLQNYMSNIGLDFGCQLENVHAASSSQVFTGVIKRGPGMTDYLNGNYNNRGNEEYHLGIGESLIQVAGTVPQGMLVFFSSYGLMEQTIAILKRKRGSSKVSLWEKLEGLKPIITEPKRKSELSAARAEFASGIRTDKGAIFLAVCRGKVSEGIDFADAASRAVVIVGIPYPPLHDPRIKLKKLYLLEQKTRDANAQHPDHWYQTEGFRAVNQAIGRVLRHVNDFGVVVLLDSRFSSTNPSNFPSWLRPSLRTFEKYDDFHKRVISFFRERGQEIKESKQNMLLTMVREAGKVAKRRKKVIIGEDQPLMFNEEELVYVEDVQFKTSEKVITSLEGLSEENETGQTEDMNLLRFSSSAEQKKKELVPTTFGSVSLASTTISVPPRKKVKLLRKTLFLQPEGAAPARPNNVSQLAACMTPLETDKGNAQEQKIQNGGNTDSKQVKGNMSNGGGSGVADNKKPTIPQHLIAKTIEGANKLNNTGKENDVSDDVNVLQEVESQLPAHFKEALNMGIAKFKILIKESGLVNQVLPLIKSCKDTSAFHRTFQHSIRVLLPDHPKVFVGLAQFFNHKQRKQMIEYAISRNLKF